MHLIEALAAGIVGADSGTVTIYQRGTSTPADVYEDFEGASNITDALGVYDLDAHGAAVLYVSGYVTCVVRDSTGTTVRTFTVGADAGAVEVRSSAFTGTAYVGGASAAGNPMDMETILGRWMDSAGAVDWKVLFGGSAVNLQTALGALSELVYNVKNAAYGAVGDGTTDDTSAIQAAINAANTAGGGVVFFPEGTYRVTSTLTVYGGIILRGVSKDASKIMRAASTGSADIIDVVSLAGKSLGIDSLYIGASGTFSGVVVDVNNGMTINMQYASLGDANCTGTIVDMPGSACIFTVLCCHLQVGGTTAVFFASGLTVGHTTIVLASKIVVPDGWAPATGGIGMNNGVIAGNWFATASGSAAGGYALYLYTSSQVMVAGNRFNNEINAYYAVSILSGTLQAIGNSYSNLVLGSAAVSDFESASGGIHDREVSQVTVTTGTTVNINPSTTRTVFISKTGANNVTIGLTTKNCIPGDTLDIIVKNSSGGAITFTFQSTDFQGEHTSVGLSVPNGDTASWRFIRGGTVHTTKFVQCGAHEVYT